MKSASLHRDQRGNVAVITCLSAAILTGIAGLSTIYVQSLGAKTIVQASLDAAVLAATAMPRGTHDKMRAATAKHVFDFNLQNGLKGASADIVVTENVSFSVNLTEVTGIAKGRVTNSLGAALNITEVNFQVGAQARKMTSEPLCILALNPTDAAAIEIYGNAAVNANDCTAQANSTSDEALKLYGNKSAASAKKFGVSGNFSGSSWKPQPTPGTEPVSDPYIDLPVPTPGSCTNVSGKLSQSSFTLDPGTYCGGLNIGAGASVKLNPGVYIMKDGTFSVGSGASVSGDEVLIALVGANSFLELKASSKTTLTSPMTGIYKNIQFMSDRDLSLSKFEQEWTTILSGATLDYDGVMYLPEQQIWASGTGHDIIIQANSPSLALVVNKIWAQGNVVIEVTQENPRGLEDVAMAPGFGYGAMLTD